MGVMTLENFQDEVWISMGQRTELDPNVAAPLIRLNRAINKAYRHVTMPNVYQHSALQTTNDITMVTDTSNYSLTFSSVPVWAIHQVKLESDEVTLKRRDFRRINEVRLTSARPSFYARWGDTIYLNAKPTSNENGETIRVYHWLRATSLTATGTTVLGEEWDAVITEGAKFYAWLTMGVMDRADIAREVFASLINDIGSTDKLEAEDDGARLNLDPLTTPYMPGSM